MPYAATALMSRPTGRRFLAEQTELEGIRVARAEGSHVWDDRRRKYIDFVMGWCVGNLGWGLPEIRDAIARTNHPDYVYPHYDYKAWHDLAELLADIAPGDLTRSFRATGGTEAVEIALQIAMVATGRNRFVSIEDSYHGNSFGTLSVAASDNRDRFPRLLDGCDKIKPPLDTAKLDRVERLLKKRDVAAFIMEPIAISIGVLIPGNDFMVGLQRLCRRYGTLLIMDEVACGFGRTGNVFATEHFDIAPDILTMSKAMSAGYGGIGATMTTERVHRKIKGKYSAYSTYGWHPLAVDAAIANLRYWKRYGNDLLVNCVEVGAYLERRLKEIFGDSAKVHAKGLAIAVEFDHEEYPAKLVERCRKKGLLVTSDDEYLQILPAVNVENKVAERAMNILASAV
jgi:acetylornithine/succinyldiaminopimelate/putrescine aminotransferase